MNHHGSIWYGRRGDLDRNWSYALPEEIYQQILQHDTQSNETRALFEILHHQISLFTAEKIPWDHYEDFTNNERIKWNYRRTLMYCTETIQSRLIQVVEKLKSDQNYKQYHDLLPNIEFDDSRRQMWYELEL